MVGDIVLLCLLTQDLTCILTNCSTSTGELTKISSFVSEFIFLSFNFVNLLLIWVSTLVSDYWYDILTI